jgi:hypothetical protein
VLVSKLVDKQGKVPSEEDFEQLKSARMLKNLVPARYSNREDLGQLPIVTVKEGEQELPEVKLTSR